MCCQSDVLLEGGLEGLLGLWEGGVRCVRGVDEGGLEGGGGENVGEVGFTGE